MKRPRNYDGDLILIKNAKLLAGMALRELDGSGARQSKKKLRSALKSLDGAIRNAEGHRSRP